MLLVFCVSLSFIYYSYFFHCICNKTSIVSKALAWWLNLLSLILCQVLYKKLNVTELLNIHTHQQLI